MATEYAADGKVETFEGSVLADGLAGILRTGGCETAGSRGEGADAPLVEDDGQQQ
jgi:hypothetical protein